MSTCKLNYALALTVVTFPQYFVGTIVGLLPFNFLFVFVSWACVHAFTSVSINTLFINMYLNGSASIAAITLVVVLSNYARTTLLRTVYPGYALTSSSSTANLLANSSPPVSTTSSRSNSNNNNNSSVIVNEPVVTGSINNDDVVVRHHHHMRQMFLADGDDVSMLTGDRFRNENGEAHDDNDDNEDAVVASEEERLRNNFQLIRSL